jgi:4-hydroxy-2-oxoheptanedioate aldolase
MATGSVLDRLTAHRPSLGTAVLMGSPLAAEALGHLGFDFVWVDLQHGLMGRDSALAVIQTLVLCPPATFVRVSRNHPADIGWALDAGADGVVVPLVETAEDARSALAACRYPPGGVRSWGPVRAMARRNVPDPVEADRRALCVPMIETATGVGNIGEIMAVDGIELVLVGPSDLALSLGLHPSAGRAEQEHRRAVERVLAAGREAGVHVWVQTGDEADARRWAKAGAALVSRNSDLEFMVRSAEAARSADLVGDVP